MGELTVFKRQLDGSDSKTFYPLHLGIGPVGQYSSLQGWGGGLGANVQIAGFFYLNGGVTLNANGTFSEFLGVGLRNFL